MLEAKRLICSPFFIWGSSLQKVCGFSIALALAMNPAHLDKCQVKSLYLLLHGHWVKLWDPGRRTNIQDDRKWQLDGQLLEYLFHFPPGEPRAEMIFLAPPRPCPTADFSFLILICFPNSAGLSMVQIKARCAPSCLGESDLVRGLGRKKSECLSK